MKKKWLDFLFKTALILIVSVWILLVIFLGVWLFVTPANAAPPFSGRVVGIADGDTLTVLAENTPHKIRLAEIDAPEKKQAWGERAKQSLSDLCFNAEAEVTPATTDRYGRTIARVRCGGVDASLYQVSNGLAWAYTDYLTDPAIATAERAARDSTSGLWVDKDPTPPWLYRKGKK